MQCSVADFGRTMMKRRMLGSVVAAIGSLGLALMAASCSSGGPTGEGFEDEGVGAVSEGLSKCLGGKLGASDYCSATCPCNAGEGDCDGDSHCIAPAVCSGHLSYFNPMFTGGDACAPAHCRNKIKDVDETQTDCGGSCGTNC